MDRLADKYNALGPNTQIFVRSFAIATATYATALLGAHVGEILALKSRSLLGFHAILVIAIIAVVIAISIAISELRGRRSAEAERRVQALHHAHTMTDSLLSDAIAYANSFGGKDVAHLFVPHDPMSLVQKLIRSLYSTLEAYFSAPRQGSARIDFEVTFMTRSYADHKLTVAAWANRDGRKPVSLSLRDRDPDIYGRTVTSQLYTETRAQLRIIEDTADPRFNYVELYDRQRDRIKSSVVYPVLSNENALLGTIVAHCDRPGFFRQTDEKFWRELVEIFAKRVALEKLRLDHAVEIDAASPGLPPKVIPASF